jgi:hypothetical protein
VLAHRQLFGANSPNTHPSYLVLVTGIQPTRVCAAKESLHPQDWGWAWISVTSTEMREAVVYARRLTSTLVGEEEKSWS